MSLIYLPTEALSGKGQNWAVRDGAGEWDPTTLQLSVVLNIFSQIPNCKMERFWNTLDVTARSQERAEKQERGQM